MEANLNLKECVVNEILIKMKAVIDIQQQQILETVLTEVLYYVEIVKMETALSTHMDDNLFLLEAYETNVLKDGLSPKSVNQYINAMKNMLTVVDKNIRDITSMDIKKYLNWYAGKGNKACTVNTQKRFISAVYTWFRKHRIVTFNPAEAVPNRKEIKKRIEYLKEIEIELLRENCISIRERALMEFLLSTGVRIGEVPLIQKADVDWVNKEIVIFAEKTGTYRTVFLTDTAALHLKRYLEYRKDNNPGLFVSCRKPHKPMKRDALRNIIKKLGKRAGIGRLYPHIFRKTLATNLRMKGCAIEDIQKILGHADASTTIGYYAGIDDGHLRQIYKKYIAQGA